MSYFSFTNEAHFSARPGDGIPMTPYEKIVAVGSVEHDGARFIWRHVINSDITLQRERVQEIFDTLADDCGADFMEAEYQLLRFVSVQLTELLAPINARLERDNQDTRYFPALLGGDGSELLIFATEGLHRYYTSIAPVLAAGNLFQVD